MKNLIKELQLLQVEKVHIENAIKRVQQAITEQYSDTIADNMPIEYGPYSLKVSVIKPTSTIDYKGLSTALKPSKYMLDKYTKQRAGSFRFNKVIGGI